VHYLDMTLDDVGPKSDPSAYHVINFNHGAGPRVVDQHALVVELGPQTGYAQAVTIGNLARPGLPKEEDHIALMRDSESERSRLGALYFNKVVAHELAHSVDVYHHGDLQKGQVTWQVDSSGNITENGQTIYVKSEGEDPSILKTTVLFQKNSQFPIHIGNYLCTASTNVGVNGQQSGDMSSYMRYDDTFAYIPFGFPQVRFWTGRERFGTALTNHPQGTFENDPSYKPGPRYGDAFSGAPNQAPTSPQQQRGNDSAQLDVNDKNNALIRPTQQVCP
jgi:hypothetical protein